jgi:hypothetical protein
MRKKLVLIAVALLALVMLVSGFKILSRSITASKARNVSEKFIDYTLADNTAASYQLFSASAKKSTSTQTWGSQAAQISTFFVNQRPHYKGVSTTSNSKIFRYGITGTDGQYVFTVNLIHTNGWQVTSFTSSLEASS